MLVITLILISAAANGLYDRIQFHWNLTPTWIAERPNFWNPKISWKNKYKKDLETPNFFLSTTLLVFLTDGIHLLEFIRVNSIVIAISLMTPNPVIYFLILRLVYWIGWKLTYR